MGICRSLASVKVNLWVVCPVAMGLAGADRVADSGVQPALASSGPTMQPTSRYQASGTLPDMPRSLVQLNSDESINVRSRRKVT